MAKTKNEPESETRPCTEIASFAAGCFWGIEDEFRKLKGVLATAVGFMGGHTENPTYREVCTDETGHAETVQIEYDPEVIAYEQLLDAFWNMHDPTTLNRQGPDVGSQYRSAIFFHTPEQQSKALKSKAFVQEALDETDEEVVTEIVPATVFTKAEEHHQQYFEKSSRTAS